MKITVKQKELKMGTSNSSKASAISSPQPIIETLLFNADENISITGNNLQLAIKSNVEGTIVEQGKICIDAKLISNVVNKFPDNADITFESFDNSKVKITCLGSEFLLNYIDGVQFPEIPIIEDGSEYVIPSNNFKKALKNALVSAAKDGAREVLKGCFIDIRQDFINIVGIDGLRISLQKIAGNYGESKTANIPVDSVKEIIKMLPDTGDIKMVLTNNFAIISFEKTIVLTRLLEGSYVDYERILPHAFDVSLNVKTQDLIDSMERISLITANERVATKLEFTDDKLKASAENLIGKAEETISITDKVGENLLIAFNNKIFIEGLKLFESNDIKLQFINNVSPCKMSDSDNSIYIVFPVRM